MSKFGYVSFLFKVAKSNYLIHGKQSIICNFNFDMGLSHSSGMNCCLKEHSYLNIKLKCTCLSHKPRVKCIYLTTRLPRPTLFPSEFIMINY